MTDAHDVIIFPHGNKMTSSKRKRPPRLNVCLEKVNRRFKLLKYLTDVINGDRIAVISHGQEFEGIYARHFARDQKRLLETLMEFFETHTDEIDKFTLRLDDEDCLVGEILQLGTFDSVGKEKFSFAIYFHEKQ